MFVTLIFFCCCLPVHSLIDESDAFYYYNQGLHFQYTMHDMEQALKAYNMADQVMTDVSMSLFDYSGMYNDLGVLWLSNGDINNAEISFVKALQISSTNTADLTNLAGVKHSLGDLDTSNALYQLAVNQPDATAELLFNYGNFL